MTSRSDYSKETLLDVIHSLKIELEDSRETLNHIEEKHSKALKKAQHELSRQRKALEDTEKMLNKSEETIKRLTDARNELQDKLSLADDHRRDLSCDLKSRDREIRALEKECQSAAHAHDKLLDELNGFYENCHCQHRVGRRRRTNN